jgi:transcriptional regulator with XRE-family HTH domain
MTQAELARRLDVSQPVVARLERGGANPRVLTLERAIAATGQSLDVTLGPPSGIDETMIAADLERSHDERLRRFESFYEFASAFGGRAADDGGP